MLQFLPDYRLYPGLKLRVSVAVNSPSEAILVEVPHSDGSSDENGPGRSAAVQDGFVRAFVKSEHLRPGVNRIRIAAVDPGVVLDRLALRAVAQKSNGPNGL